MYTIKRHKLLNLFYVHDRYSGPIKDEYEVVENVEDWREVHQKVKEYESNNPPNTDGIFDDYYKYEHMKAVWGDPEGIKPSIGQLFFLYVKEGHSRKRTLFELCEVKNIQEPYVIYQNHGISTQEKCTLAAFQRGAMIPGRDKFFIKDFEKGTHIRYPRNLISTLIGKTDYRQVRRQFAVAQGVTDWDLPAVEYKCGRPLARA